MIWNSVIAMTAIDLIVIGAIATLAIAVYRLRRDTAPEFSGRGSILILAGLAVIALSYFADLLAMHVFPAVIGAEASAAFITDLHLEVDWIVDATSIPLICTGFLLEVFSQRRGAAALEASESRYRSIVQDQTDYIVRWLPGGIRTWVNEPYCRAYGLSPEEALGSSFFPLIGETDVERIQNELLRLSPEKPLRTGIHEVNLPGGTKGWHEWTDRALFDSAGKLIEIQSVGRDVTDRLLTEHALQESESRFRGFVENTHDWVWQTDRNARYTFSNSRVHSILGYTPQDIAELSFEDLVHASDIVNLQRRMEHYVATRSGWGSWVARYVHRNGSIRYLESAADPVLGPRGELKGFRGISRDRTFESILSRLTSDLVGCSATDIDEKIEQSLERIAMSYDLDRIGIWWIRNDVAELSHEWVRDASDVRRSRSVAVKDVPVSFATLRRNLAYKVAAVADLPADSLDRKHLESLNAKAILALPLFDDERMVGIAVCAMMRTERTWPVATENELRELYAKIAVAWQQAQAVLSVIRRERDLVRAEELAQVGSFAFERVNGEENFPAGWQARFSREFCLLLETVPNLASYELLLSRVWDEDRPAFDAFIKALAENSETTELQYRVVTPGGRNITFALHAERELDRDGDIVRIVGSNRDITEHVEREQRLVSALEENEILRNQLQEENIQLREEIRTKAEFEQIIGDSAALRSGLELAARAAPTDAAVLVLGETGTGKELVAKAIHQLSARQDRPLVSVNCTALPANLVESELFGHERGAFTGAANRRTGRFERANGGTLFLDEIGDLPLDLQAKLLRVLQDGSFERLGGTTTLHADVRLIAATNRNLAAAVRAGEFRADLYYRISTVPIHLPPLRERPGDIPLLAHHFVAKHNVRLNKNVNAISTRMLEYLQAQEWPGNIRELEHFIERSMISATGEVLTLGEQFFAAQKNRRLNSGAASSADLRSVERDHIVHVLDEKDWVIDGTRGAAATLGLAPSTLRSKMKRLGIARRA